MTKGNALGIMILVAAILPGCRVLEKAGTQSVDGASALSAALDGNFGRCGNFGKVGKEEARGKETRFCLLAPEQNLNAHNALNLPGENAADPGAGRSRESWLDHFDLDSVTKNPWLIAAVFLLIQWFEIWYYNRTGKKSSSIDAAEAALFPFMGKFHRWMYRQWRKLYFRWNPEKKDPDKDETKEDTKP